MELKADRVARVAEVADRIREPLRSALDPFAETITGVAS